MFSALGRIVMVALGYLAAAVVSVAVIGLLGLERATAALHGDDDALFTVLGWARHAFSLSFATTLVLSVLVVIIGEVARIRTGLYYIAAGGAALAAAPLLIEAQRMSSAGLPVFLWQVCATAGFAGGVVYWLIAGRKA
jgi:hypothetical protein